MKEKLQNIFKNGNIKYILMLIIVALIVGSPMIRDNLDVYYDDGIQHISRAFGTYEAIKNGISSGNIIIDFSNGFGYSWNFFYGAFTTYGIILFKIITGTYITGYKLYAFLVLLFSGFFMYKFVSRMTSNKNIGVLAGVLYMIAPYHLTDLYTRNAIAEFTSFLFLPLVFWGLHNIIKKEGKSWYLTIGAAGLVFTHNITTLYTAILSIIYLLVNFKSLKDKEVIKKLGINIFFIFFITLCFTVPFLEAKLSTNYRVFEENSMVIKEDFLNERLPIRRIFVTGEKDGGFVFELGLYMIIMLAFSFMTVRMIKEEYRKNYLFFLFAGIITLLMTTKFFPWEIMPNLFYIIQFPWRCMEYASFFFSIVAAINMGTIIKNYKFRDVIIITTISVVYIMSLSGFVIYSKSALEPIENFEMGKVSGMNNENIIGMARAEYLPSKAYDNRFYIATREDKIYVTKGKAIVDKEEKNGTNMTAKIETFDEKTEIEFPYIFYPGYKILADGIEIKTFATDNGFLGCDVPKHEKVTIEVSYTETESMKLATKMSIAAVLVFIIYILKMERDK